MRRADINTGGVYNNDLVLTFILYVILRPRRKIKTLNQLRGIRYFGMIFKNLYKNRLVSSEL